MADEQGHPGSGHLAAGTMVLGEATKPIEDVKVGDRVWTGEGRAATVINTRAFRSEGPFVRVHVHGGFPLTCTADYRLLTRQGRFRGWVRAEDLTEDDCLVSPARLRSLGAVPPDLERFWNIVGGRRLLGFFLVRGSARDACVEIPAGRRGDLDEIKRVLGVVGLGGVCSDFDPDGANFGVRIADAETSAVFRKCFRTPSGGRVYPSWAVGDPHFLHGVCHAASWQGSDDVSRFRVDSRELVHGAMASLRSLGYLPAVDQAMTASAWHDFKAVYDVSWWRSCEAGSEGLSAMVSQGPKGELMYRAQTVIPVEGDMTVYDVGVDDAKHSLLANGFVAHSCASFGASPG